jgi:hypothetical protein
MRRRPPRAGQNLLLGPNLTENLLLMAIILLISHLLEVVLEVGQMLMRVMRMIELDMNHKTIEIETEHHQQDLGPIISEKAQNHITAMIMVGQIMMMTIDMVLVNDLEDLMRDRE